MKKRVEILGFFSIRSLITPSQPSLSECEGLEVRETLGVGRNKRHLVLLESGTLGKWESKRWRGVQRKDSEDHKEPGFALRGRGL